MPFPAKRTIKLDFGEIGAPEFWVELHDPRDCNAGDQRAISKAAIILTRSMQAGQPPSEEDMWAVDALHKVTRSLLVAWNLPSDRDPAGPIVPLEPSLPEKPPEPPAPTKRAGAHARAEYEQAMEIYRNLIDIWERGCQALHDAYDPLDLINATAYGYLLKEVRVRLTEPPKSR